MEVVVWKPCINGLRLGVMEEEGVGRVVVLEERVVDWEGGVSKDGLDCERVGNWVWGSIPLPLKLKLPIVCARRGRRWCL